VGGVGAVRVTPAVIQPGRVGRGVTGGVLDSREALPAVGFAPKRNARFVRRGVEERPG
jgi:hypothetical protein